MPIQKRTEARKKVERRGNSRRKSDDKLDLLLEFGSVLNSSLNTSVVRELAMQATCKLLDCDGATLYLVDAKKNELFFEAVVGSVSKQSLQEFRLPIGEQSIAGTVALHRKGLIVNDVSSDSRHNKSVDEKNKYKTKNMVCVPVVFQDRLLGVLQALHRERSSFKEADKKLLELLANQVAIAIENARLYESLKHALIEIVASLTSALEAKDRYTAGHTRRVALFSELIAKYLGFTRAQVEDVRMAAMLHDVGKIGIDDSILKKQSSLEGQEWEHMKQHPELGFKILAHVEQLKMVVDGMRYHHERPDGHGYPLGLKGEEIPMIARIISVADTFDAMTSTRPYRKGLPYETAFEEILRNRGSQFDEKVVDAFAEAFRLERMGKKRLGNGQ